MADKLVFDEKTVENTHKVVAERGIDETYAYLHHGISSQMKAVAEQEVGLIHSIADLHRDKLAVSIAPHLINKYGDHAFNTTADVAADALEDIIDKAQAGCASHSQRVFAESVRENRDRAKLILTRVMEDPAIQRYWEERAHYHRPPKLTVPEARDLRRLVDRYFESVPTMRGEIEKLHARRIAPDAGGQNR